MNNNKEGKKRNRSSKGRTVKSGGLSEEFGSPGGEKKRRSPVRVSQRMMDSYTRNTAGVVSATATANYPFNATS